MNLRKISKLQYDIRKAAFIEDDEEKATVMEKELFIKFAKFIATTGTQRQRQLANAVLSITKSPFRRI